MVYLFILLLACCWGPSFFFIKIALRELSPLTLLVLRIGFAGLILWGVCLTKKRKVFKKEYLKHFAIMGFFAGGMSFYLVNTCELYISSSLASVINGTVPLMVIPLAYFAKVEKITLDKVIGIVLGIIGLVYIFSPGLGADSPDYLFGIICMSLAALCYAIAMVYAKVATPKMPSLVLPTGQLLVTTLAFLPLALIFEDPLQMSMPAPETLFSLLALSIIGTVCGFLLYYKIISMTGPTTLSIATLLFPVIGLALGVLFLNEPLTHEMIIGSAAIFSGLLITNPQIRSLLKTQRRKGAKI